MASIVSYVQLGLMIMTAAAAVLAAVWARSAAQDGAAARKLVEALAEALRRGHGYPDPSGAAVAQGTPVSPSGEREAEPAQLPEPAHARTAVGLAAPFVPTPGASAARGSKRRSSPRARSIRGRPTRRHSAWRRLLADDGARVGDSPRVAAWDLDAGEPPTPFLSPPTSFPPAPTSCPPAPTSCPPAPTPLPSRPTPILSTATLVSSTATFVLSQPTLALSQPTPIPSTAAPFLSRTTLVLSRPTACLLADDAPPC